MLHTFCYRINAQIDERQVVITARLLLNLQGKINTGLSDFRVNTFDYDNLDCKFTYDLIAENTSQCLVKSSFLFCLAVTNVFCILEI